MRMPPFVVPLILMITSIFAPKDACAEEITEALVLNAEDAAQLTGKNVHSAPSGVSNLFFATDFFIHKAVVPFPVPAQIDPQVVPVPLGVEFLRSQSIELEKGLIFNPTIIGGVGVNSDLQPTFCSGMQHLGVDFRYFFCFDNIEGEGGVDIPVARWGDFDMAYRPSTDSTSQYVMLANYSSLLHEIPSSIRLFTGTAESGLMDLGIPAIQNQDDLKHFIKFKRENGGIKGDYPKIVYNDDNHRYRRYNIVFYDSERNSVIHAKGGENLNFTVPLIPQFGDDYDNDFDNCDLLQGTYGCVLTRDTIQFKIDHQNELHLAFLAQIPREGGGGTREDLFYTTTVGGRFNHNGTLRPLIKVAQDVKNFSFDFKMSSGIFLAYEKANGTTSILEGSYEDLNENAQQRYLSNFRNVRNFREPIISTRFDDTFELFYKKDNGDLYFTNTQPLPEVSFECQPNEGVLGPDNFTVSCRAQGEGVITSFIWDFGDESGHESSDGHFDHDEQRSTTVVFYEYQSIGSFNVSVWPEGRPELKVEIPSYVNVRENDRGSQNAYILTNNVAYPGQENVEVDLFVNQTDYPNPPYFTWGFQLAFEFNSRFIRVKEVRLSDSIKERFSSLKRGDIDYPQGFLFTNIFDIDNSTGGGRLSFIPVFTPDEDGMFDFINFPEGKSNAPGMHWAKIVFDVTQLAETFVNNKGLPYPQIVLKEVIDEEFNRYPFFNMMTVAGGHLPGASSIGPRLKNAIIRIVSQEEFENTFYFKRGDFNNNDIVDLTDPIALLNYLFQGGPAPHIIDAADSNDDNNVSLTDAIHLLNFLFLGGSQPPEPFVQRGPDVTP